MRFGCKARRKESSNGQRNASIDCFLSTKARGLRYKLLPRSVLSRVGIPHLERASEEVLSERVDRVLRLLDADLLKPLGKEGDQVVLEVHADVL